MPKQSPVEQIIKMDPEPLWKLAGRSGFFVRIAGISGCAAVVLGAYGAHSEYFPYFENFQENGERHIVEFVM